MPPNRNYNPIPASIKSPLLFRMSILKSGYASYDGQKHPVFQGFSLCGYKYSRSE